MASENSESKGFLSDYVKSKKSNTSSNSSVSSDELNTFGINPLRESETHKRIRQMLDEATNAQTQIALED